MILLKHTISTTQYMIALSLCYRANWITSESLTITPLCLAIVFVWSTRWTTATIESRSVTHILSCLEGQIRRSASDFFLISPLYLGRSLLSFGKRDVHTFGANCHVCTFFAQISGFVHTVGANFRSCTFFEMLLRIISWFLSWHCV